METLPSELVFRIVSLLPYSSILAIFCVTREYNILNNPTVWEICIRIKFPKFFTALDYTKEQISKQNNYRQIYEYLLQKVNIIDILQVGKPEYTVLIEYNNDLISRNIRRIFGTDHRHSALVFIFPANIVYYTFHDYQHRLIDGVTHIGIIDNNSELQDLVQTYSLLIHESFVFVYNNAQYDIKNELWLVKDNKKFNRYLTRETINDIITISTQYIKNFHQQIINYFIKKNNMLIKSY